MVLRQGEAGEDVAFCGAGDAHCGQEEVVDRAAGEFGLDEVLDVSVLGGLGGHDDGWRSDDCWSWRVG